MSEFRMPSLGADMDAGRLSAWMVAPGQRVSRGDIVATVDTDKGAIDVEIWEDSVVAELLVEVGEEVPVGTVLARLTTDASAASPPDPPAIEEAAGVPEVEAPTPEPAAKAPTPEPAAKAPTPEAPRSSALGPPSTGPATKRPPSSPSARRLARELGVDLSTITGTGPHGAIAAECQWDDVPLASSLSAMVSLATVNTKIMA